MLETLFLNAKVGEPSPIQTWMREHNALPVVTVGFYLLFVYWHAGHRTVTRNLNRAYFYWNLGLTLFSLWGVSQTLPRLYRYTRDEGFYATVCRVPWWEAQDHPDLTLAVGLFIWSKFPELVDTVFLVYQNKPVRVIHWFHHATVLLYTWYAYVNPTPAGIWFATMNYTVHALMYFYYAFQLNQKLVQIFITGIQITQMVLGTGITVYSMIHYYFGAGGCRTNPGNFGFALAIYVAYLVLFVQLFDQNYHKKRR
jgi:elongation of very long chain fatty acids protein 6